MDIIGIALIFGLLSIGNVQCKAVNSTKPEHSNSTAVRPASVESRFFDFGGFLGQLFPGFNQGIQGGSGGNPGGIDFPGNSQFYPDTGPVQFPTSTDQGNKWTIDDASQYPNQGNFRPQFPQQQVQYPGQDNFGIPQSQRPSQGNFGRPQEGQEGQYPSEGQPDEADQTQRPNQGGLWGQSTENGFRPGLVNDGTLDGLAPPEPDFHDNPDDESPTQSFNSSDQNQRPSQNSKPSQQSPGSNTNAILGRPVIVPTTSAPEGQIVYPNSTDSGAQRQCVQDCQTTSEYRPVCGTNGVTYFNSGRFICARNCGVDVFVKQQGRCDANAGPPGNDE